METGNILLMTVLYGFAGLSIAVALILLGKFVLDTPPEDRTYLDPPPTMLRLIWPLIHALSHRIEPLLTSRYHQETLANLRLAGLDFSISPAQFLAARLLWPALIAIVVFTLLTSIGFPAFLLSLVTLLAAWLWVGAWLKDRIRVRRREMIKTLPYFLDMTSLCVEAGLNLSGALEVAVDKGPPGMLRDEFRRVMRDIRAGKTRVEALRAMAARIHEPAISSLVSSLVQAETLGMNLGPVLQAQAEQRRNERFLTAEKEAMQAPVRMLLPLVLFIFPCTFIVIAFPILMKFKQSGFLQ